jgi:beta propeller repeat protein
MEDDVTMKASEIRILILLLVGVLILIPAASGVANVPVCTDPATQDHVAIDGTRIVWDDTRNGIKNVYMSDITTGAETRITTDSASNPEISGNRIVWEAPAGNEQGYGSQGIRMKDLSTGAQTTIISDAWGVYVPTISDNYVAYNRFYDGGNCGELYDISTGTTTRFYSTDEMSDEFWRSGAHISGDHIVYTMISGAYWVYMYNINTGEKRQIAPTMWESNPEPDISGNYIVYCDDRNDNYDIYLYNIATGVEQRITTDSALQCNPAISGTLIVWQDHRNGNADIYAYDLTTGIETQITTDPTYQTAPDISGTRVIWKDFRNGNADIFMADLATGGITVTVPNGGEQWTQGSSHSITWRSVGTTGSYVKIELLKGTTFNRNISSSTANDGIINWTVPATLTPGTDYRIRITSTSNSAYTDTSNTYFSVVAPTAGMTVTAPNGGEKWAQGSGHSITWSTVGTTGSYVKIELLKGTVVNRVLSSSTANDGSFSWTVPSTQTLGTDYRIRITSTTTSGYTDTSNAFFSVVVKVRPTSAKPSSTEVNTGFNPGARLNSPCAGP